MNDYGAEAQGLLANAGDKARCLCGLCGRLYTERPPLCLCKSNVFLEDLDESEVVTDEMTELSEKMQRRAQSLAYLPNCEVVESDPIDRGWWSRLHLMGREKRVRFIVRAYGMSVIDDYALWDVLSYHNGPVSYRDAVDIYQQLGFVSHAGYPLTIREIPERNVSSEGGRGL